MGGDSGGGREGGRRRLVGWIDEGKRVRARVCHLPSLLPRPSSSLLTHHRRHQTQRDGSACHATSLPPADNASAEPLTAALFKLPPSPGRTLEYAPLHPLPAEV